MLERIAELKERAVAKKALHVLTAAGMVASFLAGGYMAGSEQRPTTSAPAFAETDMVTPLLPLRGWGDIEVSVAQEDLPSHITYYPRSEQKYLEGSARIVKPLAQGDIWLAQAQKLRVMGVDYNINPEANPGRAIVFAIGAVTPLDLDLSTVQGVYAWTGLESTPRVGSDFVQDIMTAGRVQVSRAQIPGNCTPSGCSEVTLVTAVGHRDGDGVVRFDAIPDEHFTK